MKSQFKFAVKLDLMDISLCQKPPVFVMLSGALMITNLRMFLSKFRSSLLGSAKIDAAAYPFC